ncbi:hypothetical protein X797_011171 [Metarhizium robertsii]|uniref:Uncharacterized protein n=2 Tax=Metarhizium robertsii TaxID=568076 RepID=E9FAH1_METRA|nr:uncharacterized protein MAA_09270 [Metarhizium robertsii ARSEF 23]EFY95321.1 hypothetical protein MAA_09270 [Metarhizium robertsii ARSEF 23]EXU95716.1 hypothetical protein X797_011171 [Metarhizium robertsii]
MPGHAESAYTVRTTRLNWLRDLIPLRMAEAGILAFRYNANILHGASIAGSTCKKEGKDEGTRLRLTEQGQTAISSMNDQDDWTYIARNAEKFKAKQDNKRLEDDKG